MHGEEEGEGEGNCGSALLRGKYCQRPEEREHDGKLIARSLENFVWRRPAIFIYEAIDVCVCVCV